MRRNPYTPAADLWDRHELRVEVTEFGPDSDRETVTHLFWPAGADVPVLVEERKFASIAGQSQGVDYAISRAKAISRADPRNPHPVRVFSEEGICITECRKGACRDCAGEEFGKPRLGILRARATERGLLPNPWTPDADRWDRHELRLEMYLAPVEGWRVVHVTWPAYGGAPTAVALKRMPNGDRIGCGADALDLANTMAERLSAAEPRSPNPVVVRDDRGECVFGWRAGKPGPCPGDAVQNPPCTLTEDPRQLGRRLKAVLHSNEVMGEETIRCLWDDVESWTTGGCWIAATAIRRWFGCGRLWGVYGSMRLARGGSEEHLQHVAVRIGDWFFDADGAWTADQLLAIYQKSFWTTKRGWFGWRIGLPSHTRLHEDVYWPDWTDDGAAADALHRLLVKKLGKPPVRRAP